MGNGEEYTSSVLYLCKNQAEVEGYMCPRIGTEAQQWNDSPSWASVPILGWP